MEDKKTPLNFVMSSVRTSSMMYMAAFKNQLDAVACRQASESVLPGYGSLLRDVQSLPLG